MSELQVENLQNSCDLLTMQETSLIMGGAGNVTIKDSFNDTVAGGLGGDVIVTDPLQVNVDGREIYGLKDFGIPPEFLDKI